VTLELIKVAGRLQAMWSEPSPQLLQLVDNEVFPKAVKMSSLRQALSQRTITAV
jgi:hypothetical protein